MPIVQRTNWDAEGKSSPTGMPRDYPLAATGHHQARDLAGFLSSAARTAPYPPPGAVYSSPLYRCVQTALPTAKAVGVKIKLEHGVQEWYGPARAGTGLHPRPDVAVLRGLFQGDLDDEYTSTVYPSRRGETIAQLHDRIGMFLDAWTARVDESGEKSVVIFAHAATVIAMGRMVGVILTLTLQLTGDLETDVTAGCAVTSLYRRKAGQSGCGAFERVYDGRADYMPGGVERDWAFSNIEIHTGETHGAVPDDEGDFLEHTPEDELPVGLAPGMERYLRKTRSAKGEVASRL